MDEQVSWKGHSFTLLVFGGIVFLCSIFFVLGMLVGRGQGKSAAEAAVVSAAVKAAEEDARLQESQSVISPYQGITTGKETNKDTNKEIKTPEIRTPDPAPTPAAEKPAKTTPKVTPAAAPASPKTAPAKAAPAKTAPAKPAAPAPVKMMYLQVTALENDKAANKEVERLKKAGFPAVVMGGDGPKALYKVQVGPFATAADAEISKRKLEAMGYKPIRK